MARRREYVENAASGLIVGAVDAADTTCTITNGSLLPSSHDFRLAVWNTQHGDAATARLNGEYDVVRVTAHTGDTIDTMVRDVETGLTAMNWAVSGGQSWQWDLVYTKGQWDAEDVLLDNALTQNTNWINVQASPYNATGDGTTDDTTAIDDAITAATGTSTEVTTVYFPPGTYNLPSWNTVSAYTKPIRLLGHGATILGDGSDTFLDISDEVTVEGITFDSWDRVFDFDNLVTAKSEFHFRNCVFDTCGRVFHWIVTPTPDATGKMERISIENCIFKDLTDFCVELRGQFDSFSAINCEVDGAFNEFVRLGYNTTTEAEEAYWNEARVIGCNVYNIQSKNNTNSTAGVIMYGHRLKVEGCNFHTITCGTSAGNESWGIYTKCRQATITGNTITDINDGGGSSSHGTGIRIKGDDRANDGSTPRGYNVVCTGNNIFQNGASVTNGINISQDNVLVANNLVDNFDTYGIEIDADSLDNIIILGNGIRGDGTTASSVGIRVRPDGTGITVQNNDIEASDDGIHIKPTSGTLKGASFSGNKINVRRNCYDINPSAAIEELRITDEWLEGDGVTDGFEIRGTAITSLHISGIQFASGVNVKFNMTTEPTLVTTSPKMNISTDIAEVDSTFLTVASDVLTVTGNLTGDVTGDVTGDLTGSVTGANGDTLMMGDAGFHRDGADIIGTADSLVVDVDLTVAGDATVTTDLTVNGAIDIGGKIRHSKTSTTLASNAFTAATSWHELEGEGVADDQLDTISGGTAGDEILLTATSGRTITVADGAGNLELDTASFALLGPNSTMRLLYDGTNWLEMSRSSA